MTKQEKIIFLEELMEMEEGTLTADMELDDLDEWDSLSRLMFVAEVKKLYGKSLTMNDLQEFLTIEDICNVLP